MKNKILIIFLAYVVSASCPARETVWKEVREVVAAYTAVLEALEGNRSLQTAFKRVYVPIMQGFTPEDITERRAAFVEMLGSLSNEQCVAATEKLEAFSELLIPTGVAKKSGIRKALSTVGALIPAIGSLGLGMAAAVYFYHKNRDVLALAAISLALSAAKDLWPKNESVVAQSGEGDVTSMSFRDVAGAHEAKRALWEIVGWMKDPAKFAQLGGRPPRGILLAGSPGNGKTLLARAFAGEAGCNFFFMSGASLMSHWVGESHQQVAELFETARANAPAVIFIDELDAVGLSRSRAVELSVIEREVITELLHQLDGFDDRGQVIVLAATNHPHLLDPALVRPGRFDRVINVPLPRLKEREEMVNIHARFVVTAPDFDPAFLALHTEGMNGAQVAATIQFGANKALRDGRSEVTTDDCMYGRDVVAMGEAREDIVPSAEELWLIACHEAGHALMMLLLPYANPLYKVTINPNSMHGGVALGLTVSAPAPGRYSETENFCLHSIMTCLGGGAAEKVMLGQSTSGVSSDYERAAAIARSMVADAGMSELGAAACVPYPSEAMRAKIEDQVEKILRQCQAATTQLLTKNKAAVEKLAHALVERKTLSAAEVIAVTGIESVPRKYV